MKFITENIALTYCMTPESAVVEVLAASTTPCVEVRVMGRINDISDAEAVAERMGAERIALEAANPGWASPFEPTAAIENMAFRLGLGQILLEVSVVNICGSKGFYKRVGRLMNDPELHQMLNEGQTS